VAAADFREFLRGRNATSSNSLTEGWVAIIDDDESIRRSLARILRINDLNARTFASAEEFLCSSIAEQPLCMVVDVNLGGMSGFALQDRLTAEGRTPPIIFITAMDEIESGQLEQRAGREGYFRKPFETKALVTVLRQYVCAPAQAAKQ
jgi:FixJ family two-component response regulator